jgi:hypothetical protein
VFAWVMKSPVLGNPVQFADTTRRALDAMVSLNCATLKAYPDAPRLYSGKPAIVFQPEPPDFDSIVDMCAVLERRHGDCAHLACYRLAELQTREGEPEASLRITFLVKDPRPKDGVRKRLFHVQITRADASVEDPSVMLGMQPNLDFPLDHWPDVVGAPIWVRDAATWRRAERAVFPHWKQYHAPYAVVAHVYKQMGGRIR